MALINQARLKQYLKLNYNVLFEGEHGVGKTAVIKQVFEDEKKKWLYFSASTLDPWVDFVGVPKVVDRPDGSSELKLIRPSYIENDEVEAIFFDELNRAPDKVINAIMELIQFKSINGHKLKNLKVIWAAINPEDDDDTYSVNHLDPAHLDRFQVRIKVPFEVDEDYFRGKYPDTGQLFIDWWKEIPEEIQKQVSPRRLDYAAHAHENGCRLEDFLPTKSNPAKLRKLLTNIPFAVSLKKITTPVEAAKFLNDVNNATRIMDLVKAKESCAIDFFIKYGKTLPAELAAPFAEHVFAHKAGVTKLVSLEELIEKLPDDSENGVAAIINGADLDGLYRHGGSLEANLKVINSTKKNLIAKLANRISDVLVKLQTTAIARILWGQEGKAANRPTNFHKIAVLLSKIDPNIFTSSNRQFVNTKLHGKKVVDTTTFI